MPRAAKLRLSRERLAQINQALREAHDIQPDILLLEECGMECAEYRETIDEIVRQLTGLKERFA
jgi:hypothetical protein